MNIHKQIFFLLCVLFFPFIAQSASSNLLGVSPSSEILQIYKGDVLEKKIILSRSGNEDVDIQLHVEAQGEGLIRLDGGDAVSIPKGKLFQEFSYTIDASQKEIGTYQEKIFFTYEGVSHENVGLETRLQLIAKVEIEVIDPPAEGSVVAFSTYEGLRKNIAIQGISLSQSFFSRSKEIQVSLEFENTGKYPISEVPIEVSLFYEGFAYRQERIILPDSLSVGKYIFHEALFTLNDAYPSGKYTVQAIVGKEYFEKDIYIIQYKPFLNGILILTILFVGAGIFLGRRSIFTRRKKDIRSHEERS